MSRLLLPNAVGFVLLLVYNFLPCRADASVVAAFDELGKGYGKFWSTRLWYYCQNAVRVYSLCLSNAFSYFEVSKGMKLMAGLASITLGNHWGEEEMDRPLMAEDSCKYFSFLFCTNVLVSPIIENEDIRGASSSSELFNCPPFGVAGLQRYLKWEFFIWLNFTMSCWMVWECNEKKCNEKYGFAATISTIKIKYFDCWLPCWMRWQYVLLLYSGVDFTSDLGCIFTEHPSVQWVCTHSRKVNSTSIISRSMDAHKLNSFTNGNTLL